MFRTSSDEQYEEESEGGVRNLFRLGPFEFHDTLDDEGSFHHFVLEAPADEEAGTQRYEIDTESMYELMARFLAGEYEKAEYGLERSPGHDALLDLLELATARARAGGGDFSLEDLEHSETEVLDEGEDEEEEGEEER